MIPVGVVGGFSLLTALTLKCEVSAEQLTL